MTSSSNLTKFGICDISPEISHQFLSLNNVSTPLPTESDEQKFLRNLLTHFDLLTSCNLRDFLRAKLFFESCQKERIENQALGCLINALTSWANLDYAAAKLTFNSYLDRYPCDVIVFFMLHMMDFCCGNTPDSLSLIHKLDLEIFDDHPLYGYYLGIKSFVMCESNNFQESLEIGLKSLRVMEENIYAIHAVSHAYHEMDKHEKIIKFLNENMIFWIDNPGMKMHVYWHIALAELSLSSIDHARTAFGTFYSMKTSLYTEQDLDAVGFLWRYKLCFPDDNRYQDLWSELADNWTGCIGASTSYFHDVHGALAFAAVNKPFLIKKMIARSDGAGIYEGSHLVGIEILQSIYYYSIGQYHECAMLLTKTRKYWAKIGGSNIQRNLLWLTLQDAMHRSGMAKKYV
jgi:tetratricopeptide (TPR) repeat protein